MFQTLKNAWHIADLRKKILYTLMILVLFRLGTAVPVPFLDAQVLQQMLQNPANAGNLLGYLDILSGGAFARATIFALSITPYITSSIVIQLLTVAIPALERMAKEGEDGRRKINKITRYVTVALALLQAWAYYTLLRNQSGAVMYRSGFAGIFSAIVIIAAFMGGAMLIVYLGERIDEHGIGNGISMILFAGIVSRGPAAIQKLWIYLQMGSEQPMYYFTVPLIVVLFLALIVVIIIMTNAERRIPVQYAKKGRRPQDVRRTVDLHPHQSEHVGRSADHLRLLAAGDPGHHQGVRGPQRHRLLGELPRRVQLQHPALRGALLYPDPRVQLLLRGDSV